MERGHVLRMQLRELALDAGLVGFNGLGTLGDDLRSRWQFRVLVLEEDDRALVCGSRESLDVGWGKASRRALSGGSLGARVYGGHQHKGRRSPSRPNHQPTESTTHGKLPPSNTCPACPAGRLQSDYSLPPHDFRFGLVLSQPNRGLRAD